MGFRASFWWLDVHPEANQLQIREEMLAVLKVWMDGHGRRPGTYFRGWTPSSHLISRHSVHALNTPKLKISY